MSKKVGILTFHDGINFGAFMQAYSLQKALMNLGLNVNIVNYKSRYHWLREYVHVLKKDFRIISNIKKILKFRSVQDRYMRKGDFSFNISNAVDQYDVVIFGSDEIWNVNNGFFGFNAAYYGHGMGKRVKRIAFAPSCGSSMLGDYKSQLVKQELLEFQALSARDLNTKKIIEELTDRDVEILPDPTFLVSHDREVVEPSTRDYVLVYSDKLPRTDIERVRNFSAKHDKKIVSVGFRHDWCDENYIDIDPFEWLGYIRSAEFVFTTMFHGTLFSLMFNRQICLLSDPYRTNKFSYIIEYFGLEDALYDEHIDIDYVAFNGQKNIFQLKGISYLKDMLNVERRITIN